eukprot:1389727-Amphidinium_carterae.1
MSLRQNGASDARNVLRKSGHNFVGNKSLEIQGLEREAQVGAFFVYTSSVLARDACCCCGPRQARRFPGDLLLEIFFGKNHPEAAA